MKVCSILQVKTLILLTTQIVIGVETCVARVQRRSDIPLSGSVSVWQI